MCFELYAGTTKPLERRVWSKENPSLSVAPLTEKNSQVRTHFRSPEVQLIGSTAGCGCDFPHLLRQKGKWLEMDRNADQIASGHHNLEALAVLLRECREEAIELYGIWSGSFKPPEATEDIGLERLLDPDFHFKEQGFYNVRLSGKG